METIFISDKLYKQLNQGKEIKMIADSKGVEPILVVIRKEGTTDEKVGN